MEYLLEGVLYIAFGEQYHRETRRSIASLRKVSPAVRIAVITEEEWTTEPIPDAFILKDNNESFASKPKYMYETPFERTLFIDSDTVIARDITPIFGLLDWYDVGVRFGGPELNEPNGLEYHTQCNSGVVLFKKNEAVAEMFTIWQKEYATQKQLSATTNQIRDRRGLNDQRFLAVAIAKSGVRPVHFAEHLNFALFETIICYSPPVIFHGRLREMEMLHEEISGKWTSSEDYHARLWLPNIRGLLPAGVRRSDPLLALALILRRLYNSTRRSLRRITKRSDGG